MQFIDYQLVVFIFFTYILASVPFGLLVSKFFGLGDIRNIGSGNIGATNVLRTGNKKAAAFTLLLDALKGAIPVIISFSVFPEKIYLIGFVAIFSHIFSIFLKFKGGKGVATALGVYFSWNLWFGFSLLIIWILVAKIFKISSLSALIASVCAPFIAYFVGFEFNFVFYSALISMLILFTHRTNIRKIIKGEESLISLKKV